MLTGKKETMVHGDCIRCGRNKRAAVKAFVPWSMSTEDTEYWETHYVLECGGCGRIYHQVIKQDTDDIDETMRPIEEIENWPALPKRERPKWFRSLRSVDATLHRILSEVYAALNHDLSILAAIGIRTAFDRATEALEIDVRLSFEKKVQALVDGGFIGPTQADHVSILIDAGSAAAHRGWSPDEKQLHLLLDILEDFARLHFVDRKLAAKLKEKVPPRPSRKKT